jgi:hypothetical protein
MGSEEGHSKPLDLCKSYSGGNVQGSGDGWTDGICSVPFEFHK